MLTFEALLDRAIALLQRRRRLTYRALKRQFGLDDDYLKNLKAELIQGQRLAEGCAHRVPTRVTKGGHVAIAILA